MKEYNGSGLTPLFYSEISSSYMLYDVLKNNDTIISQLIEDNFNLRPEKIDVQRERAYPKKGSIDIFAEFESANKKYALLIEVKVHDYLSATSGQIETYIDAVSESQTYKNIYFIYLTQFTPKTEFEDIATPKTIDESKRGKELLGGQFVHISWEEMHTFLDKYYDILSEEQKLIVSLNKQWILQKCKADLESNKVNVGERGIEDYFTDVKLEDIKNRLAFGKEVSENNRQILRVNTPDLTEEELNRVLDVIKKLSESEAVNKTKQYKTEEFTMQAAKDFLVLLAQSVDDWNLLAFYSKLFLYVEKTNYLKFNGTGRRGFSIKLEIKNTGEISVYGNLILGHVAHWKLGHLPNIPWYPLGNN